MKKRSLITWAIILAMIILAITIIKTRGNNVDAEIAKCIGENSVLYVQYGCHACAIQEEMFGNNYQYLNVIDCVYEPEKCSEIQATPTWLIDGEYHRGVQEIGNLQVLTGCSTLK